MKRDESKNIKIVSGGRTGVDREEELEVPVEAMRKAIEMWGRGIGLIINACEKAHLAPPRIYEDRGFVYTVFTRPTKQEWNAKVQGDNKAATENERTGLKTRLKTGLKDNSDTVDEALRQMIKDNPAITIPMMSEATRLSRNGVLSRLQSSD